MSENDARNYRESMGMNNWRKDDAKDEKFIGYNESRKKYMTQRGTAERMSSKKKKRVKLRVAALIFAAGIGIRGVGELAEAGIAYVGSIKSPDKTVTDLREEGMDLTKLGLSQQTIQQMEVYDRYFESIDLDNLNITDDELLAILRGVEGVNEDIIKEKIAKLKGVDKLDVNLNVLFDEGKYYGKVDIENDESYFGNAISFLGLGKKNSLSKEISDAIVDYSQNTIAEDLISDDISKVNGVKKIRKLYENATKLAIKQFTIDKQGNIDTVEYEEKSQAKEGEER